MDRRFNGAPVRLGNSISPPTDLKKVYKKTVDLDRQSKLQWLFQPIPIFINSSEFSIRELLSSINNIVESLGFDISEQEFKLKITNQTLLKVFIILFLTFMTCRNQSLVNNKSKPLNLQSFIEETLCLLALSLKSPSQQAPLFIHSLESILPPCITDYCDQVKSITGNLPNLTNLVDFLY